MSHPLHVSCHFLKIVGRCWTEVPREGKKLPSPSNLSRAVLMKEETPSSTSQFPEVCLENRQPKETTQTAFPNSGLYTKEKSKLWIVKHDSDIHLWTVNVSNYTSIYVDDQNKTGGSEYLFQLLVFDLLNHIANPCNS